jgi:hypothetical protein
MRNERLLALALVVIGCGSSATPHAPPPGAGGATPDPVTGGAGGSGGGAGSGGTSTGGAGGSGTGGSGGGGSGGGGSGAGGSAGAGGAGGAASGGSGGGRMDATAGDAQARDAAAADSGPAAGMGGCAGSPAAGWTEYQDDFNVQKPFDIPLEQRFKVENGVYTAWITRTDKGYSPSTPTGPRTEMRWQTNWTTGEHMWEADVMYEPGTTHCAIMQVKSNTAGEPIYLQVNDGNLRNSVNPVIMRDTYNKWIHINVAYNPDSGVGRVWLNNCMVFTRNYDQKGEWYFKNGVYGCDTDLCRAHFKNIKFYRK